MLLSCLCSEAAECLLEPLGPDSTGRPPGNCVLQLSCLLKYF